MRSTWLLAWMPCLPTFCSATPILEDGVPHPRITTDAGHPIDRQSGRDRFTSACWSLNERDIAVDPASANAGSGKRAGLSEDCARVERDPSRSLRAFRVSYAAPVPREVFVQIIPRDDDTPLVTISFVTD